MLWIVILEELVVKSLGVQDVLLVVVVVVAVKGLDRNARRLDVKILDDIGRKWGRGGWWVCRGF